MTRLNFFLPPHHYTIPLNRGKCGQVMSKVGGNEWRESCVKASEGMLI